MRRAPELPEITLDPGGPWPLRQQLYAQLADAIRQARIPHLARLPSTRLFAAMLGVSRNTVVEAYERLVEDGLIATTPGSGVRVLHRAPCFLPGLSNLRKAAHAAHYPACTVRFRDPDGTALYLNVPYR